MARGSTEAGDNIRSDRDEESLIPKRTRGGKNKSYSFVSGMWGGTRPKGSKLDYLSLFAEAGRILK